MASGMRPLFLHFRGVFISLRSKTSKTKRRVRQRRNQVRRHLCPASPNFGSDTDAACTCTDPAVHKWECCRLNRSGLRSCEEVRSEAWKKMPSLASYVARRTRAREARESITNYGHDCGRSCNYLVEEEHPGRHRMGSLYSHPSPG